MRDDTDRLNHLKRDSLTFPKSSLESRKGTNSSVTCGNHVMSCPLGLFPRVNGKCDLSA